MRKTITGTGGMLLLQTLKDAGVEYLFTNPGSAETGLFAAIAEDGDKPAGGGQARGAGGGDGRRLPPAQRQGRRRHRARDGRLVPARRAALQCPGGRLLAAGHRRRLGVRAPGLSRARALSRAEPGRVHAPHHQGSARAYQVHTNPAAISVATIRALREATTPPTGPVYLSISAELLLREGLEAQIGEGAEYQIERPAAARAQTVEAIARRLAEAQCPVLMFGDDVCARGRAGRGGPAGRAARGAGLRQPADLRRTSRRGIRCTAACIPSPRTSRRPRAHAGSPVSWWVARACTAP